MSLIHDLFGSLPSFDTDQIKEIAARKEAQVNDAIEICKMLETPGGKLLTRYLSEIYEGLGLPPESFVTDGKANPDMVMEVYGQRTAIKVVINWLEACAQLVERRAKEKENDGKV